MSLPRLFLCSDVEVPKGDALRDGRHVVELSTFGTKANVNLSIEDLAKKYEDHL